MWNSGMNLGDFFKLQTNGICYLRLSKSSAFSMRVDDALVNRF